MKKIQFILTTIIILLCSSCDTQQEVMPKQVFVSAVVDITDTMLIKPTTTSLIAQFSNTELAYDALTIKLSFITDLSINPIIKVAIPNYIDLEKINTNDDILFRKKAIERFKKKLKDTLNYFNNTATSSINNSECFKSVCNVFNDKEFQEADTKRIFIYTDLIENGELFKYYSNPNISINQIIKVFENTRMLPNTLPNTKVYFIYQPKNKVDDGRYSKMYSVYKTMLEKRGAEVIQLSQNP